MKKFLVPAVIAIALTAGGSAFAASADKSIDYSLYEETSLFAPAAAAPDVATSYDRDKVMASQRASTAPMPSHDRNQPAQTSEDDLYFPE